MAYRTAANLAGAEREMQAAVQLDPGSQKAHYQLGLILAALERQDQAKAELATAARLRASNDDKIHWVLANPPVQGKHDLASSGK
jgi:Flp pilus assembly protein TadD